MTPHPWLPEQVGGHRSAERRPRLAAPRPPTRLAGFADVCLATAGAEVRRSLAYAIDIIRWPLYPALYYVVLLLTYRIAGRSTVEGLGVEGYLLVGTIGIVLWQGNLWYSGYALEHERQEGTLAPLLLTPASRAAVVVGYALGSFAVWLVPDTLILGALAWALGARVEVRDPLAVAVAGATLAAGSAALGFALAGAFILSRRANLLANFLQSPIYLLSGMVVPVAALPGPLQAFAAVFPIAAGMTALRRALLGGARLGEIAAPLAHLAVSSVALALVGALLLRRFEHVAKRGSELDLE